TTILENDEAADASTDQIDHDAFLHVGVSHRRFKLFGTGHRFVIDLGDNVAGTKLLGLSQTVSLDRGDDHSLRSVRCRIAPQNRASWFAPTHQVSASRLPAA